MNCTWVTASHDNALSFDTPRRVQTNIAFTIVIRINYIIERQTLCLLRECIIMIVLHTTSGPVNAVASAKSVNVNKNKRFSSSFPSIKSNIDVKLHDGIM